MKILNLAADAAEIIILSFAIFVMGLAGACILLELVDVVGRI